jgi:hypothetical protein
VAKALPLPKGWAFTTKETEEQTASRMIKFFRKIRQRMLTENPPDGRAGRMGKYLLYAIGEIVLVVIGILIALNINNWNEVRKQDDREVQLYSNLLESLIADSIDVHRVRGLHADGMDAQRFFMRNSFEELIGANTILALRDSIEQTTLVGNSFFPRYSSYYQITNNGYLSLIHSEDIKSKLGELYDRRYIRYQHIDASIDQKSEFQLEPIIRADFRILDFQSGIQISEDFDEERFKTHYPAFKRACINIFTTSTYSDNSLRNCQESIHELLILIRGELAKSNP